MVFFGTSGRWAFLSGGVLFVVLAGLKYLWFIESIEIDGVFACVCIYVYMNNHVASCLYVRACLCVSACGCTFFTLIYNCLLHP